MNKHKFGFREFIILAVIILSAYTVWPSIQVHSKKGEAKQTFLKENPKLGTKSINFGLDLAGGTSITLQIDKSSLKDGEDIKDIQAQSLEIIRNRVDQYGLSEPQISPTGDDRIVVELAGVDDSTAKALVGSTAKLEFKILAESEKFTQVVGLIDQYLTRQTTDIIADSAKTDSVKTDSVKKETLSEKPLRQTWSDSPFPLSSSLSAMAVSLLKKASKRLRSSLPLKACRSSSRAMSLSLSVAVSKSSAAMLTSRPSVFTSSSAVQKWAVTISRMLARTASAMV